MVLVFVDLDPGVRSEKWNGGKAAGSLRKVRLRRGQVEIAAVLAIRRIEKD